MRSAVFALAAAVACTSAMPANAITLGVSYDFTATFRNGPNTEISGSINFDFDPLISGQVSNLSFASPQLINYPAVGYYYSDTGTLAAGNCQPGVCSASSGKNEFYITFRVNAQGDVSSPGGIVYSTMASGIFTSSDLKVVRVRNSAVPESRTWTMMILGFATIGYAMRRKTVLRYA